jgi:hypothetical protein
MGRWDEGDDFVTRSRRVVDDQLMKDIIGDARRGDIHGRAAVIPQSKASQTEEPKNRSGWVEPSPLRSPEGLEHVDRLVDQQDRIDAAARAHQMGLSYSEWLKLSEQDIANRKAQQQLREKGGRK